MTTTNPSELGDTGATIQIEHPTVSSAIISVTYPNERRRKDVKTLKISGAVLAVVPVIAWLIFRRGSSEWFAVIASAVLVIYLMVRMIREFLATSISYIFRADRTGLTIESLKGRRRGTQHFTLGQIVDIGVGFPYNQSPNALFKCWLMIETSLSGDLLCLHNLGGDHLAASLTHSAMHWPCRQAPGPEAATRIA